MADYTSIVSHTWSLDITMIVTMNDPVNCDMEIKIAGEKRETLVDPMYKRIDKIGRVYVDRDLAQQEVLVVVVKPVPKDKINYIKVGRGTKSRQ